MNRLELEIDERPKRSPIRWALAFGSVMTGLVGLWLLGEAFEADGTWSVGWRLTLGTLAGLVALIYAVAAILGLADRRRSSF